jgi:hypothetical protein
LVGREVRWIFALVRFARQPAPPRMSDHKPTQRMHAFLESIRQVLNELETGKLDHEHLDTACADAQGLYERLVILRHKARETKKASEQPLPEHAEEAPAPVELPAVRLDTRPSDAPLRQTSLIDAIAETETPPDVPASAIPLAKLVETPSATAKPPASIPKPAKPAAKPHSVAQKLDPVADLHKAVALSQKFWFVAELFGGQRERYEQAIDRINGMKSLPEAQTFVENEVVAKAAKTPAADALQAFTELLQRRFTP